MARVPKFKLLLALKSNFNGGQFYKEISKFDYFKKLEKSKNKVGVTKEIGCRNDKVLSKSDKKCSSGWVE